MKENTFVRRYGPIVLAGIVVGAAALLLTAAGNPKNMGFCIACFERDIAGALGLHGAGKVQYLRPEIPGIVLGAMLSALAFREFKARAGSCPASRFVLGLFVMIGALVFLGCPLRMVIRLGGGDLTAAAGLLGFLAGILAGVVFLKKGFSLGRAYPVKTGEGFALPAVMAGLLALLLLAPGLLKFSEEGPGSMRAFWLISLAAGLAVGFAAQRSRLCMAGASGTRFWSGTSRCWRASWPSGLRSPWGISSSGATASPCSPSPWPTASTSGPSWAWPCAAGGPSSWGAVPCGSSFWRERETATQP